MKLTLVIQAIEEASDSYTLFYDTKEGKTVYLPDEFVTGERDKTLEGLIENNRSRFLRFPDKHEIHEYSIMEQCIDWLPRGRAKILPSVARELFVGSKQHSVTTAWSNNGTISKRRHCERWQFVGAKRTGLKLKNKPD